jgi:hypothetical protein
VRSQHPQPCRRPEPAPLLESAIRTSARLGEERSLVDLVLLACDFSDDRQEIDRLVDGLVLEAASRLLPASQDPMLRHGPGGTPS